MRAYRPSVTAPLEELEEDGDQDFKDAHIGEYQRRAELGLPLFVSDMERVRAEAGELALQA